MRKKRFPLSHKVRTALFITQKSEEGERKKYQITHGGGGGQGFSIFLRLSVHQHFVWRSDEVFIYMYNISISVVCVRYRSKRYPNKLGLYIAESQSLSLYMYNKSPTFSPPPTIRLSARPHELSY